MRTTVLAMCVLVTRAALAALPSYVPLPSGFALTKHPQVEVQFGREEFSWPVAPVPPARQETHPSATVEGHVWLAHLALRPAPPKPLSEQEVFSRFSATLTAEGWTFLSRAPYFVFRRAHGNTESYLQLTGNSTYVTVRVAEKAPRTRSMHFTAPGRTAEPFKSAEVTPYLQASGFAGMNVSVTHLSATNAFEWAVDGLPERTFVGRPELSVDWKLPSDASSHEICAALVEGLRQVGWTIARNTGGSSTGDAMVQTRYTKDGRDLYGAWHVTTGQIVAKFADMAVAADARRLKDALDKDGHIAVYGIYFDYDKATLKPESEATLRQILALLESAPALKLVIEGHTDNTGKRDHNQVLSEKRANAARGWLEAHGVAKGRLTSAGFADTRPVAPNTSAEGRAKNRRVELAKPR